MFLLINRRGATLIHLTTVQYPGKAIQYAMLHPGVPVFAPMLPSFPGCCYTNWVNKEEDASSTSLQSNVYLVL